MGRVNPQLLLHKRFENCARESPERIALFEGDREITYSDLDARADRLAGVLRARGVRQGSPVGLHLERSIDWVVGVLGILKADAAVVPLPPSYPLGRIQEIVEFAGLDDVIDCVGTPLPPSLGVEAIRVSEASSATGESTGATPGNPDQPAFVLCSSGSTGRPKMIVRSHRSFFHRLQWTWKTNPLGAGELGCQKAHMTTTHGIYELFEPLLCGVPGVIIPDHDVRNLERFWDIVRARGVTRLLIVPSALRASMDMPGFTAPPIEVLVLMGEYVDSALAEQAVSVFPAPTRVYSIYGSTEASSTLLCDVHQSFRPGLELPLGTPISEDVEALVLGADLQPTASGEAGRLYMTGSPLFTEYLGDPTLTASAFVDAPDGMSRLYDTNDQVRRMPDGSLEFVGRADHTVKIRGFRVDLLEVERAILQHPKVKQAAVLVNESDLGAAALVGFYGPTEADRSAVYEALRERLPNYMVPSALIGLKVLPRTPSGKVDRVRLLKELVAGPEGPRTDEAASDTERKVREAWRQTIGFGGFGLDDSFFEVGGDSLSLFALLQRLRETFGPGVGRPAEQWVYGAPTIRDMAARIDEVLAGRAPRGGERTPLLVTLRRGTDADQPPLFLVSSAGGTLGAYERVVRALTISREVIGVRDPFNWGQRDPSQGFRHWVDLYVEAMRERQPSGPYFVGAYSSAGAFGFEVAQRLHGDGQEVALLVLIDPMALDRPSPWRYGYWAMRATYMRSSYRKFVRLAGWLRVPLVRAVSAMGLSRITNDEPWDAERVREITDYAMGNKHHLSAFATLLELNTDRPFALSEEDFAGVEPDAYMDLLLSRVKEVMPEVDPDTIERIAVQYQLQVRAQHAYQLDRYDGPVVLFEPSSPYSGLLHALFRPHVKRLRARTLELGPPSERVQSLTKQFGSLASHYRSMRDDTFVRALAKELDALLG